MSIFNLVALPALAISLVLYCMNLTATERLPAPISVSEPAQGVFLVADHTMPDPRFQNTIILILEHNDKRGTLGLILNKPLDVTLGNTLPGSQFDGHPFPMRLGGPVGQDKIFMVFTAAQDMALKMRPVTSGLFWSGSPATLEHLLQAGYDESQLRLFIGVSSWAPGQLANELKQSGWKLFAMQERVIFNTEQDNDDDLWRHFIDAPRQILAVK